MIEEETNSMLSTITRKMALFAMGAFLVAPLAVGQTLTKADLKKAVVSAKTPQDYERIAKHFDAKAAQFETEAKDHEELAAEYKASPTGHDQKHPMSGLTAEHCLYFAKEMRRAAEEVRQIAKDHREMAKTAK
jgi:hypothetical protein